MYDSDRKYLSRFALDPDTEYGSEDLHGTDFCLYLTDKDDPDPFCSDDLDLDEPILEGNFLFEK